MADSNGTRVSDNTRWLMMIVSLAMTALVTIAFGLGALYMRGIQNSVDRIEVSTTDLTKQVGAFLVVFPELEELRRRMGILEVDHKVHGRITGHPNHPHPLPLSEYLSSIERICGSE